MENQSGWADLEQEAARLQRGVEQPKLKTGFHQLDKLLFGGLSPGLVVLGGNPGAGKSTFCLQMAENAAENGTQVLYFSYEMPANWLIAKSISRRMFQKDCPIHTVGLMGGSEDNQLEGVQWEQVDQVKQSEGFQAMLKNLHIWTAPPLLASGLKEEVLKFAKGHGGSGMGTTLVIVDYLQIVPSDKGKSDKEKNDDKVRQFTDLAHDGRFTVVLISSLNRGSYNGPMSGAIRMSSFKETGEIEYSADLLLGLQFQNQRRNMNQAKEQAKNPRDVEISILKNRYGSSGCSVPFAYYAANDYFKEQSAKELKEASLTVPEPKEKAAAGPAVVGRTRTIYRCVINNTKVANEILKGRFEPQVCEVFKTNDEKKVCVQYELSDKLSSLDCCIADAIYTVSRRLWEDGVPQTEAPLTPKELMKAVSGAPRPTVTRQKLEELRRSVERLQKIQFSFDCEEELQARGIEGIGPEKLRKYQGPFLNLEIREQSEGKGEWGGAEIRFKKGVCPLFLHTYGAEVNQQMITIPSVLLNVSNGKQMMSNTAENICLKRILAKRMEVIRRGASSDTEKMCRISFREKGMLLSELRPEDFWKGEQKPTKEIWAQKLHRIHDFVKQILDYYKLIQYISDYKDPDKGALSTFEVDPKDIRDPMTLPKVKL